MKKVKRVVLGVGYPWFSRSPDGEWTGMMMCREEGIGKVAVRIEFGDLGNYNKVRLVAEVLK